VSNVSRVEVNFPVPVSLPLGWERALDALVGMVCEQYQRENPTMVMWPAGIGSKITSMGIAAGDEHIDFDDSTLAIDCAAREDYYGDNPSNPDREKLRHQSHIERAVSKGKAVETLIRATGVWIDAEVKPLPFKFDWDQFDYRIPARAEK